MSEAPSPQKGKGKGKKRNRRDEGEGKVDGEVELVPATEEGKMPKKRFYRQRAHCNPLSHNDSFNVPDTPASAPWDDLYGGLDWRKDSLAKAAPTILDVGCGYGGLSFALAEHLKDAKEIILALEIRAKVVEYVRLKIEALRNEHPGKFHNMGVLRTNAMLYMPYYFKKASLSKIFICFPDPHFKVANHRRRIVSSALLAEYAYFLKEGGLLYTITDVPEVHKWHVEKCSTHGCFEALTDAEMEADPCVSMMCTVTEEGKKVARQERKAEWAVFRRKKDEDVQFSAFFSP